MLLVLSMKVDIIREIPLGQGVSATLQAAMLTVKGPKGEVKRSFLYPKLVVAVEGNKIIVKTSHATRREKMIIGSFEAHIINMVKGVQELHKYKVKICSGHFPMNVTVSGREFVIKNFLGESVPRAITLLKGVEVKVAGDDIIISSPDKEVAGQTAGSIEQLCRITNRDIRVFQDGCYITQKSGKKAHG